MKKISAEVAIVSLLIFSVPALAQEFDPRCNDIYDKVACTCAVRNGGRVIRPPVGMKREGLKLEPKDAPPESTKTLDGGRVAFPKYYRREGLKIHRSHALEGYLACMRAAGRK